MDILDHILVGKADHKIAHLFQCLAADTVCILINMRVAVNFDYQAGLGAAEIDNEAPDHGLSPKFMAPQLTVGQMPP